MGVSGTKRWLSSIRGRLYMAFAGVVLLAAGTALFSIITFQQGAEQFKSAISRNTAAIAHGALIASAEHQLSKSIHALAGSLTPEKYADQLTFIGFHWRALNGLLGSEAIVDPVVREGLRERATAIRESLDKLNNTVARQIQIQIQSRAQNPRLDRAFEAIKRIFARINTTTSAEMINSLSKLARNKRPIGGGKQNFETAATIPLTHTSQSATNGADTVSPMEEPAISSEDQTIEQSDAPVLDVENTLERLMVPRPIFIDLLNSFKDSYTNAVGDIQAMIDAGTREDAERQAHSLKGVSGSLGAEQVHQTAAAIEMAIQENRDDDTAAGLAVLADQIAQVMDVIEKLSAGDDTA